MKFIREAILLSSIAAAASLTHHPYASHLSKRCTNSASDRACWGDYDLSTNYYEETPETNVTRHYYFSIVNTTAAPDGAERVVLAINGSIPGPTIIADWGDTVVVHVTNSMENNGTSIHWHGIRQINNTQNDGVASITQCPTAPGDTYTYTWKATQYGTSWYHSHFSVQAWDGIFGAIIINGPATADYDEDIGTIMLTDWSYETADVEALVAEASGPPTLDTALMNGTNVGDDGGYYLNTTFTSNKRYRFRIINGAADTHFKFTIDNHTMEVIASDLVPIKPYATDIVSIGMGQRYDVVVTANATSSLYWMRALIQSSCSENDETGVLGIIGYENVTIAEPGSDSVAWDSASDDDCDDEDMSDLMPYLAIVASSESTEDDFDAEVGVSDDDTVYWQMGNNTFINQWDYPTMLQLAEGNNTWGASQEVYKLPDADVWVYFVLQTENAVPHPMHLHGHDFWVLAQGSGTYDSSSVDLQLTNAPRRDTVMMPSSGYVVIAFKTDNPGVWLMHCHIAWHTAEGLAIQLVERESEFVDSLDSDLLNSTCTAWDTYTAENDVVQDDSGI